MSAVVESQLDSEVLDDLHAHHAGDRFVCMGYAALRKASESLKQSTPQDLSFDGTISPSAVAELALRLGSNTNLRSVTFAYNGLTHEGVKEICDQLAKSKLKQLAINYNDLCDRGAGHIATLAGNWFIESLRLQWNSISCNGVGRIVTAYLKNKALTELNLSGNNIRELGARHLAQLLETNRALRHLDLSDNPLGDIHSALIIDTIATAKTVTHLTMSRVNITNAQATPAALERLVSNNVLVSLNLSGTRRFGFFALCCKGICRAFAPFCCIDALSLVGASTFVVRSIFVALSS
eukprot:TRINITY_DN1227_c0_g1_i2.p1 TRINITY_DN1227_c0_g1~~TRINITY_DN1227_c0_g1_i2.p1  ORF type:complete len:294 (-),score=41.25 TRINITY_DN1227_c0_g1_i2:944-1825(-)